MVPLFSVSMETLETRNQIYKMLFESDHINGTVSLDPNHSGVRPSWFHRQIHNQRVARPGGDLRTETRRGYRCSVRLSSSQMQ